MRILCLTARLPYPPDRGDRLRAFHFIEHLAQEHELDLVSFIADDSEREHIGALRAHAQRIELVRQSPRRSALTTAVNLWRPDPMQVSYYRSREMAHVVERRLADDRYDAAYVHLFRMAPYVVKVPNLYRIIDLTDVISREIVRSLPYRGQLWRAIYTVERPRIERFERYVANNFEESWLISQADQQALLADCPQANIHVVPNGVDMEMLRPLSTRPSSNNLIFVGHMGVFHNVDAVTYLAQEIFPLVQQTIPDCTLTIVGASPAPEVHQLAKQNPAITVTGFVSDLNASLNQAAVFVAPLRFAAGVQNKVLEAMAVGRPVVTTSIVNNGLKAVPGKEIMVADTAVDIAQQTTQLLLNREQSLMMGQAAREFVGRNFSWDLAVKRVRVIANRIRKQ